MPARAAAAMVGLLTVCMFGSAFLLFLVEPMVAKMVLPLAGGTPAVWTTSVLFFQAVLLVGYGYSHWFAKRVPWRWQMLVHSALLLVAVAFLPIHLIPGWDPPTSGTPVGWLVIVLAIAVGLPFLVLSTTSPLVQHWFSRTGHPHARDPYFLYRASSLGSAAGLLSYPFVIEPLIGLHAQARAWEVGYFTFLVLVALSAAATLWARSSRVGPTKHVNQTKPAARQPGAARPLTWRRRTRWVLLAAVPSTWMLATTSYFTTVIRPLPLLWVIPLTLYLLSFAIVFARRPLVSRYWLNRLFPFYALPLLGMVLLGGGGNFYLLAILHFGGLFLGALLCHGELAHDRPAAGELTEFFWWLAVGGAAGGLLTAVIAPQVFNDFLEYPIAIIGAALLRPALDAAGNTRRRGFDFLAPTAIAMAMFAFAGITLVPGVSTSLNSTPLTSTTTAADLARILIVFAIPAAMSVLFFRRTTGFALLTAAMMAVNLLPLGSQPVLFQERDFYGVHKVVTDPAGTRHVLIDGGVIHGIELISAAGRDVPASYFARSGPVGDVFSAAEASDDTWRVGVIGLGAGTVACYARPHQTWTFYEIDPVVAHIALDPTLFTFMHDCAPRATVVLGDGRLTIARAPDQSFDLIMLDAFGGDAPPVHLLTREALQVYVSKLRPGGVLLFNISNKYVDLAPVLAGEAAAAGLKSYQRLDTIVTAPENAAGKVPSDWVVMIAAKTHLGDSLVGLGWQALGPAPGFPLWTDDFNNVLSVTRLG